MAVLIPIPPNTPHFTMQVVLDSVLYGLQLHWNARAAAWYLDIFDGGGFEDANLIAAGRKVVVDGAIWLRLRDARLPPGMMVAVDTSSTAVEAGINDLGARVQLMYLSRVDLGLAP